MHGLAAVLTLPLHHGDKRLGALDLYRNLPGTLDPPAAAIESRLWAPGEHITVTS